MRGGGSGASPRSLCLPVPRSPRLALQGGLRALAHGAPVPPAGSSHLPTPQKPALRASFWKPATCCGHPAGPHCAGSLLHPAPNYLGLRGQALHAASGPKGRTRPSAPVPTQPRGPQVLWAGEGHGGPEPCPSLEQPHRGPRRSGTRPPGGRCLAEHRSGEADAKEASWHPHDGENKHFISAASVPASTHSGQGL